MLTTSPTLLGRLRDSQDANAWRDFDHRYRELIVRFIRSRGLQLADAEDAAQVVLAKLIAGLRSFDYDASKGGFRAYLFRCIRNALADHFHRQKRPSGTVSLDSMIAQPNHDSEDSAFAAFEREWVNHHFRLAVRQYRNDADERAVIMLEATIAGRSVRSIADELSMTEAAVHKAQQRLRDRLKVFIAAQLRDEEDGHARGSHT